MQLHDMLQSRTDFCDLLIKMRGDNFKQRIQRLCTELYKARTELMSLKCNTGSRSQQDMASRIPPDPNVTSREALFMLACHDPHQLAMKRGPFDILSDYAD